ncbi:MAG TPA: hypothetical protein ENK96_06655 [Desulfobulbaceae bacterium]|nr:hypothetical protein [Desulfobulbaceae bacterium]
MHPLNIQYIFRLPGGNKETFALQLDPRTLELPTREGSGLPDWCRLDFHQCPNCRDMEGKDWCPAAAHLSRIVHRFTALLSYEEIQLRVITAEREIRQETTIQRAIASYMGLVMATSGCPHTAFLRPMARFHLPLANDKETMYRAFSMYALAQFFIARENGTIDMEFQGLKQAYEDIQRVNQSMVKRLRAASEKDSSVNALVNLDLYARSIPFVFEESLEELRTLYAPYLNASGSQ